MVSYETLLSQTKIARAKIAGLAKAHAAKADVVPPGWNNNVRWHVGHLVTTPHRLTSLMLGEPMGIPDSYNAWFAKGTSPKDWGGAAVPSLEQLAAEMDSEIEKVFAAMKPRWNEPFPKEYETSVGIVLRTPGDGLTMSYLHDGIHLGLLLALARALKA